MARIFDENIERYEELPSPERIVREIPSSSSSRETVMKSRDAVKTILDKGDGRKIIIAGPCSVHSIWGGLEYASKLKKLSEEVNDKLLLVMRTYVEKPRTTDGWPGIIIDPGLDGTCDIEKGIRTSRKFLSEVTSLGVPCANEFVSLDLPQYIVDFISWAAIGARTIESHYHRRLASGLSMPVGLKNSTSGDIEAAVNAALVAR